MKRGESDAGGKYGYYLAVPQVFFEKIHAFRMKALLKIGQRVVGVLARIVKESGMVPFPMGYRADSSVISIRITVVSLSPGICGSSRTQLTPNLPMSSWR
jgi:hypothetical protein